LILRPGSKTPYELFDRRRPLAGKTLFNGMHYGAAHHSSIGVQLDFPDLRGGRDSKA
jgi:hypothetical protein